MPLPGIWSKLFWGLAGLGALWACLLGSLTNPWIQRHALYANKLHSAWWQDLDAPEKWGYLKNQIRPFNISTPDGEVLYAWHVLPLDVYHKHEKQLLAEPQRVEDYRDSIAYKTLTKDPESKLIVNFHGNAGHVGQGWRTDCYRVLSLGSQKTHVIAFDYRGFGYSTGSPTETGLMTDGIAAVDWILKDAKIKPAAVALVGQSLGTAVATAVAEHFASVQNIEFAGLVLISPFSGLIKLLSTYSLGGVIPIFSPLAPYPQIQRYLESKVVDTWDTATRIFHFIQSSEKPRLYLVHAKDDFDIHWSHSTTLFYIAANATSQEGLTAQQVDSAKIDADLGAQGTKFTWAAEGKTGFVKKISHHLLQYGGHNRVTTYPTVSNIILEIFDSNS